MPAIKVYKEDICGLAEKKLYAYDTVADGHHRPGIRLGPGTTIDIQGPYPNLVPRVLGRHH